MQKHKIILYIFVLGYNIYNITLDSLTILILLFIVGAGDQALHMLSLCFITTERYPHTLAILFYYLFLGIGD